jgi:hypothetical protein
MLQGLPIKNFDPNCSPFDKALARAKTTLSMVEVISYKSVLLVGGILYSGFDRVVGYPMMPKTDDAAYQGMGRTLLGGEGLQDCGD